MDQNGSSDRQSRVKPSSLAVVLVCILGALILSSCGSSETADPTVDVAEASAAPEAEAAESEAATEVTQVAEPAEDAATDEEPAPEDPEPEEPASEESAVEDAEPEEEVEEVEAPADDVTPVSFNDDFSESVQPILAEKCVTCHGIGGPGASHWVLGTAQDAVDTHLLISGVISSGYMPPWPASELSVDFHENRSLDDDEMQAILDWSVAGAPLDVAADSAIPPIGGLNRLENPDVVVSAPNPYAGDPNITDDYRCQIYDPELPDGGIITGYEFVPDRTDVVHHAIGYIIDADRKERALARDGEDGKPGWECYGSSGLGGDDIFLGWAPGQDPTRFPEGSGLVVEPGAFIVVQIHYHYEGDAPADASTLAIDYASDEDIANAGGALDRIDVVELVAPVEIPCASWEEGPLCDRSAALADARDRFGDQGVQAEGFNQICGVTPEDFAHFTEGVASSRCDIPLAFVGGTGELVAVLGHMHEIGDWMRLTVNAGTPDEFVLLDIDDWDFNWQYNYRPVDSITFQASDVVTVECGWDRARRSPDLEPAYILWADGTNDEMCFATLTMRK